MIKANGVSKAPAQQGLSALPIAKSPKGENGKGVGKWGK